jgi:Type II secretory pathway, component PulD
MIEALVVDIYANKTNTLGVNFANSGSMYSSTFPEPDPNTGNFEPFTFIMDKGLIGNALEINAKLEKLISDQSSEILSRPSVLVLDGRQARIVVGQQIPIARSTATGQNVVSATEYIPIGIVLNLRPRISSNGNEITMQVETIISEAQERVGVGSVGGDVLSAPTFSSRKVQTYVQVEDNTPFIIGGLISHKDTKQENQFPILGRIPILGELLGFNKKVRSNKEVIVVITPHIVDVGSGSFAHVIS